MEETNIFCYTFSKETTEKILNGEACLGPGGAKAKNGQMLELGRPMLISKKTDTPIDLEKDIRIRNQIATYNMRLDFYDDRLKDIQDSLWLNNASVQQLTAITLDGFSYVIDRLDVLSEDIRSLQNMITELHQNERLREFIKYVSTMKSILDFMSTNDFNATASLMVMKNDIDEIMSYISILTKEFYDNFIDGKLAVKIIFTLVPAYSYIVKCYSALFFYENNRYPIAYDDWISVIISLARDKRFRNRLEYWARVGLEMPLEDKLMDCKLAMWNIQALKKDIEIDKEYALIHSKEEYLGRKQKMIDKIIDNDYAVINGHLLVSLDDQGLNLRGQDETMNND